MLTALHMLLATSFVPSEDSVDSQKDSAEPEKSMNQEVPIEEEREADVDNTETNESEDEDSNQVGDEQDQAENDKPRVLDQ